MRTIPLLHYPGAKWKNASWIVSFMPTHHSYLEPYCGSAAVLFNKAPAPIETVNDLDNEIPNLFRVMRNAPEELARRVYLTPYSRSGYDSAYLPSKDDDELGAGQEVPDPLLAGTRLPDEQIQGRLEE